jgi:hypothetical protein
VSTTVQIDLTNGKPPCKVGIYPQIPLNAEAPDGIVP